MKETLTTNNMETLNPAEKKVEETAYVDTKKLAEEALAHNAEFKEAADEDKRASAAKYEEIKNQPVGETENKKENKKETAESPEAHLAKRKEFAVKVIQMMIDNLQDKLDKKGVLAWAEKKLNGAEYEEALNQLKGLQKENRPGIHLAGTFAFPSAGRFTDAALKKEIFSMVSTELEPEDQEAFLGNKNLNATVRHSPTDVSQG